MTNQYRQVNNQQPIIAITPKHESNVFKAMATIIEERGATAIAKHLEDGTKYDPRIARNKMVGSYDVHMLLKKKSLITSIPMVEAVLDILIKYKYVRYFDNDKDYRYFGVTGKGWEKWDSRKVNTAIQETAVTKVSITSIDEGIPQEWLDASNEIGDIVDASDTFTADGYSREEFEEAKAELQTIIGPDAVIKATDVTLIKEIVKKSRKAKSNNKKEEG